MTTHGHARRIDGRQSKTYISWLSMIGRCTNPSNHAFCEYGGRGISVCRWWRVSFENFLADMGEKPDGYSIERINNDGDYEPGNCKWATRKEQANNRRHRSCGKAGIPAKGFSFKKDRRKWKAYRYVNGKQIHIGYFDTEQQAADALARTIDEGMEALK